MADSAPAKPRSTSFDNTAALTLSAPGVRIKSIFNPSSSK